MKVDDKIFLIGFMGVGKSYLGAKMAEQLEKSFYDIDLEIEKKAALPVNEIFSIHGEKYFRKLESDVIQNWKIEGIIATGGGIVLDKKNREFLKQTRHKVVWLNPSWEIILSRIENSYRPIVLDRTNHELYRLWEERQIYYEECADIIFAGSELSELIDIL
jgi:shikimate kinase